MIEAIDLSRRGLASWGLAALVALGSATAVSAQSGEFFDKVLPAWQEIEKECTELQCVVKGSDGTTSLVYSSGANRLVRTTKADGTELSLGVDRGVPWGAAIKEVGGRLEYLPNIGAGNVKNNWLKNSAPLFAAIQCVGPKTWFIPLTEWDWSDVQMTGKKIVKRRVVEGEEPTTLTVYVDPENRYRLTKWSNDVGSHGIFHGTVTYDGPSIIPVRVDGFNPINDIGSAHWTVTDAKKCTLPKHEFGPQAIGADNAPLNRFQWAAIGGGCAIPMGLAGWGLLRKSDK